MGLFSKKVPKYKDDSGEFVEVPRPPEKIKAPWPPAVGEKVYFEFASSLDPGIIVAIKDKQYLVRHTAGLMNGTVSFMSLQKLHPSDLVDHGGSLGRPEVAKLLGYKVEPGER